VRPSTDYDRAGSTASAVAIFQETTRRYFENLELSQVEEIDCGKVPELAGEGLENHTARVFEKTP
jgi:hypothetical protein